MDLLVRLQLLAFAMAVTSVLWALSLIGFKQLRQRQDARRRSARKDALSLLMAYAADEGDRRRLPEKLARQPRLLAEAISDYQSLVRGEDGERLIANLVAAGVDRLVLHGAHYGRGAARLACLEACAAFSGEETYDLLLSLLSHAAPEVRLLAARALVLSGGPLGVAKLLDMISRGVLPQSDRVADLLTRLTLRAPGETIRALERWTLPELVKARLLNALAQSGDYQALPVITKAVGDRSIMVRAAAVDALGALQHPDCENALRSALQDESWEVRMRAATAIGAADLPDLSDALLVASEDAIWLVRSEAAKALLSMSDHGVEKLRALASDLRRTAPGRSLGPDPKAAVA